MRGAIPISPSWFLRFKNFHRFWPGEKQYHMCSKHTLYAIGEYPSQGHIWKDQWMPFCHTSVAVKQWCVRFQDGEFNCFVSPWIVLLAKVLAGKASPYSEQMCIPMRSNLCHHHGAPTRWKKPGSLASSLEESH